MTQFETLGLRAVIFDMDGLIFDTEALYQNTWPKVGAAMGLPITAEDAKVIIGRPPWECEHIFKARHGDGFCMAAALDILVEFVRARLNADGMPLKPGALELLALLRKKGIPTALGTSNISAVVTAYLERADLTHYFNPIVTGDLVDHAKPAPDIFLKAAASLGLKPAQCLVLEDSPIGIEAAHRAGCLPAMVPDLLSPTGETKAKAWRVFETLEEVKNTLFL